MSLTSVLEKSLPKYTETIPSTGKKISFRPFLVKEEKILLMAQQSADEKEIIKAIKQVVNNCSVDPKLDVNKLALFDLEYIFLKLRSVSVDNVVKIAYRDSEDKKVYDFEINLEEVKIKYPDKMDNKIKITPQSGIIMKYPSAALYDDKEFLTLEKDYMFELIIRCIESIYFEDQIYESKDYKKEELNEFLENLNIKVFEQVQNFLLNVPRMEYKIIYQNELGNDREIVLSSLNDFFTWR